jgi:hypothetical protein
MGLIRRVTRVLLVSLKQPRMPVQQVPSFVPLAIGGVSRNNTMESPTMNTELTGRVNRLPKETHPTGLVQPNI